MKALLLPLLLMKPALLLLLLLLLLLPPAILMPLLVPCPGAMVLLVLLPMRLRMVAKLHMWAVRELREMTLSPRISSCWRCLEGGGRVERVEVVVGGVGE